MNGWNKIALAAAGCGAIVYAYARRLGRMKANLVVTPAVSVYSLSLTGLVLRADVLIKNPSNTSFRMKFPFVTLFYKDVLLGSSNVVDQDIPINAYGEAVIQKIMIEIPLSSVFSMVTTLLNSIQNKQQVKITTKITTVVDLGWTKTNYEDTQEIILRN